MRANAATLHTIKQDARSYKVTHVMKISPSYRTLNMSGNALKPKQDEKKFSYTFSAIGRHLFSLLGLVHLYGFLWW